MEIYLQTLTSHGEDADEKANRPARQHDFLLGIIAFLLLASSPNANTQDKQIEQCNTDNASDINHLVGSTD
jgi:hypothetical protein